MPWRTLGEFSKALDTEHRMGCDTVGFFIKKHGSLLMFAAGVGLDEDSETLYFNAFAVPRAWIKSLECLSKPVKKVTKKKLLAK